MKAALKNPINQISKRKAEWISKFHQVMNEKIPLDVKCVAKILLLIKDWLNLAKHIAAVHEGKKPFKCGICDYRITAPLKRIT